MKKLIFLSALSIAFISCVKEKESVKPSGKMTTDTVNVEMYKALINNSAASVEMDASLNKNQVIISGDENFVKNLKIINNEGNLSLDSKKDIIFTKGTKLTVKINNPNLEKVTIAGVGSFENKNAIIKNDVAFNISGAGNIVANVINTKTNVSVSGAGSVTLNGKTNDMTAKLAGVGNLDAEKMEANVATITISGAGNAKINTVKEIDINISGVGNLDYKKYPNLRITKNVSGIGTINAY
ncbi:DUF2807 domain-containing protein [Flavobacterium sp. xlx-214]|uniref:head GIN domain-containing protein n=1 Tax=unclassified Flavobacterium TaxID=196869 RepID=UPI0013D21405|nr:MULTISPECIES: head GIN domain-containing protein [unclassified Flavobacterium]MBA5791203.1 DUF2807 domain-containing protein [Flavobacterium sp. xlx-221]QMI83628.1 DUF2807 domain-containing protein [Flavobacterium sp. xlx-214]